MSDFSLIDAIDRNLHLLKITRLLTVFEVYDSEDEAVRSFSANALRI